MKYSKQFIAASVLALTIATAAVAPAGAATIDKSACSVNIIGTANTAGDKDSRFSLANGTVSAQVKVAGDSNCTRTVTLAVWEAPNAKDGRPYSEQKLFSHKTATFGVGTHTISTNMPDCFYQVDMVRGASPTAADGGPVYPKEVMMGSLHGGTKPCAKPAAPAAETKPAPQAKSEAPAAPVTQTPETLPNVGTGSSAALAAVAATVLGTTVQYVRVLRRA